MQGNRAKTNIKKLPAQQQAAARVIPGKGELRCRMRRSASAVEALSGLTSELAAANHLSEQGAGAVLGVVCAKLHRSVNALDGSRRSFNEAGCFVNHRYKIREQLEKTKKLDAESFYCIQFFI